MREAEKRIAPIAPNSPLVFLHVYLWRLRVHASGILSHYRLRFLAGSPRSTPTCRQARRCADGGLHRVVLSDGTGGSDQGDQRSHHQLEEERTGPGRVPVRQTQHAELSRLCELMTLLILHKTEHICVCVAIAFFFGVVFYFFTDESF